MPKKSGTKTTATTAPAPAPETTSAPAGTDAAATTEAKTPAAGSAGPGKKRGPGKKGAKAAGKKAAKGGKAGAKAGKAKAGAKAAGKPGPKAGAKKKGPGRGRKAAATAAGAEAAAKKGPGKGRKGRKRGPNKNKSVTAAAPVKAAPPKGQTSAAELWRLVSQLRKERQDHLDSIAEIEQTFKEFGIPSATGSGKKAAAAPKKAGKGRRGRPPANPDAAASGKGKRGKPGPKPGAKKGKGKAKGRKAGRGPTKFEITGDQLIINFVKDKGGASTEDIRKHWETSGRRGKAENNLTNLVKSGKLKRTKLEGKPGSIYSVP